MRGSELIELAGAPQCQRQVHLPELPAVLYPHAFQMHRYRLAVRAVVKQIRLLGLPDQRAGQRAGTQPSRFIEFA